MVEVETQLTRDQLVEMAVDGYFGSVVRGDKARIASLIAPDCVMHVVSAGIEYAGKQAIIDHFDDFLGVYDRVEVTNPRAIADAERQQVAVRFTITLINKSGSITMNNCNFFEVDAAGLFARVDIYMSDLPEKGF